MIYVLDASAVLDLLVRSDPGERVRTTLADVPDAVLLTDAHLDAEAFSGLARLHRAGELELDDVTRLLERLASLTMRRVPITHALLERAWALRDNVAARDALYVAAAQELQARLITTDERLARAVPDLIVPLH